MFLRVASKRKLGNESLPPVALIRGLIPPLGQIDGETVRDFIFLASKITEDGDCSHEIKDSYSLEEKL